MDDKKQSLPIMAKLFSKLRGTQPVWGVCVLVHCVCEFNCKREWISIFIKALDTNRYKRHAGGEHGLRRQR